MEKIIKKLTDKYIDGFLNRIKIEIEILKPTSLLDDNYRFVKINTTVSKAGCAVSKELIKNEKKFKELLKKEIELNVKHTRNNQENAGS